jgi:phosphohistidine phosphatase
MKTLYIVRHAKSSWKDATLHDFKRALSKRGEHDLLLMGKLLREKGARVDYILSSSATRAKRTASGLADALGGGKERVIYDDRLYEASLKDLLKALRNLPKSAKSVMLVGHNPSLNILLDYLVPKNRIDNIVTTAVAKVGLDIDSWSQVKEGVGELLEYEYPKKYYVG